ncbi:hypothetical protein ABZP36_013778 [Zizania latifolia]
MARGIVVLICLVSRLRPEGVSKKRRGIGGGGGGGGGGSQASSPRKEHSSKRTQRWEEHGAVDRGFAGTRVRRLPGCRGETEVP